MPLSKWACCAPEPEARLNESEQRQVSSCATPQSVMVVAATADRDRSWRLLPLLLLAAVAAQMPTDEDAQFVQDLEAAGVPHGSIKSVLQIFRHFCRSRNPAGAGACPSPEQTGSSRGAGGGAGGADQEEKETATGDEGGGKTATSPAQPGDRQDAPGDARGQGPPTCSSGCGVGVLALERCGEVECLRSVAEVVAASRMGGNGRKVCIKLERAGLGREQDTARGDLDSLLDSIPVFKKGLWAVSVRFSSLGDEGADRLLQALLRTRSESWAHSQVQLRELDLSHSGLSPAGVASLCRALPGLPHLERLSVAGNPLGDEGVGQLGACIGPGGRAAAPKLPSAPAVHVWARSHHSWHHPQHRLSGRGRARHGYP